MLGGLLALWLAAGGLSFGLSDAEGRRHTAADLRGSRAAVFLFIAPECPISNGYAPELGRIHDEYGPRGVLIFAVHADPRVTAETARRHAREFSLPFPVLLDPAQSLARRAGATVTPEAAVFSPDGVLLYRGRVDDRVAGFGKERPAPQRRDLRVALDEILAGRPVSQPFAKAIGCAIPFPAPAAAGMAAPTFARDVAPILYRRCAACHRPGSAAPFPLLSYGDAAPRAGLIAQVTGDRYMPPWLPAPGYGKFAGERRLADAEIATLRRWADAGAPSGDLAQTPPAPHFPTGWQLGQPDVVAEMRQPYAVPAEGPDRYQCFAVPLAAAGDRYVRAMEIRPGEPRAVHHVVLFQDITGTARRRDSGAGYECFGTPGFLPARGLGGWTPGGLPLRLPAGMPQTLYRGADLVLQVHYHPTGKPASDRTAVALYFTPTPPERTVMDIALGSNRIDIPPGERAYQVTDHFTLPVDVDVLGIIPHAHYICREMKGWAVLPGGARRWLIRIPEWNFNWQEQYHYAAPIPLPAGTTLQMEYTYDNSDANPRNPSHPPRRVVWGPGSEDEMAGLHIQAVPRRAEDQEELGRALWGKMIRAIGGGVAKPR